GEPKGITRPRLLAELEGRHLTSERVDADLRETGLPSEVGVVRRLDPGLADPVAGFVALLAELLQLSGRDLARVTQDLGSKRGVRVVAEVDLRDLHSGELRTVLVEVVDLLLADGGLHDDRRQRVVPSLVHLPRQIARRDVEYACEPLNELVATC